MSANDIANCPWGYASSGCTEEETPFMTAAIRKLDETFKAGVAYRRITTAPWVAYANKDAMLEAMHAVHLSAWEHFSALLPGWTHEDIQNLYVNPVLRRGLYAGNYQLNVHLFVPHKHEKIPEPDPFHQGRDSFQKLQLDLLFQLEKLVNKEAKKLERITALEARLAAAEEAAAFSDQRQLAMAAGLIHAGALEKRLNKTDELNAKLLERLEASEAANAKLLERLSTLEKLLI